MAGIIKAGNRQSGTDVCQSSAFNFEDISDKAHQYLDSVRRQAAQILTDAKQQAKQHAEQLASEVELRAKEQGRQTAIREAEQSVQSRIGESLKTALPALNEVVESLRQSEQAWLKHWERETVRLACAIAARVIRRELRHSPEIPLALVREALELAMGSASIRLHLNPQDREALDDQISGILGRLRQLGPTEVVSDPEITPGGCRVVTEYGQVDQRIETQLARIEQELT